MKAKVASPTKVTPAGLVRELIFWPILILCFFYTACIESDVNVLLIAVTMGIAITTTSESRQKRAACWWILAIGLANAIRLHYPTAAMFFDFRVWLVNRLIYVFGPAFFLTPLLERTFEEEDGRHRALSIGLAALLAAFIVFGTSRIHLAVKTRCDPFDGVLPHCVVEEELQPAYTPEQFYDDFLLGTGALLVFGAFLTEATATKKPIKAKIRKIPSPFLDRFLDWLRHRGK